MKRKLKIVTLGGGGGHAQVLRGLVSYPHQITAVCTASDSGGGTGQLASDFRQTYGVNGSLGDVSKCCCALSKDEKLASDLLYRFPGNRLGNLSLKNLVYTGLILQHGPAKALERLHSILGILARHRVTPVSFQRATLKVRLQGGQIVSGETYIDNLSRNQLWDPRHHKIADVWLTPHVQALPEVLQSIREADIIVVAPGDLFTSCIPVVLAGGIASAVKKAKGKFVYILSLMTKLGETDGYDAADFVRELARRTIGRYPDIVLANNNGIPPKLLKRYMRKEHKIAVVPDQLDQAEFKSVNLIRADLWSETSEGYIVHDPGKTAVALSAIFNTF